MRALLIGMVLALAKARATGLQVDKDVFKYAEAWFEEVTDPNTGQCGYTKRGQPSSTGYQHPCRPAWQSLRLPPGRIG